MRIPLHHVLASTIVAVVFVPVVGVAATLSFEHNGDIGVSDEIEVRLVLDATDGAINALEGVFTFSPNLEVKEIRDGNSFVSLWLERPQIESGAIRFSGIVPGGYALKSGSLFSVVFVPREQGTGELNARSVRMLLNDGSGTPAQVSVSPSYIAIVKEGSAQGSRVAAVRDAQTPESFQPEIGQSDELFDGKHFVVFTTQDKRSGIAGYEVYESPWNIFWVPEIGWKRAESPYVLEDQSLGSYIYIRATDKAGNTRVEMLWPQNASIWNVLYLIVLGGLLIGVLYSAILILKYLRRRYA